MQNTLLVIPAIKKNAVIPDQLIKKLNGITLIQRAINTALDLVNHDNILIITDSEEISLICERNKINFYYESTLKIKQKNILDDLKHILKNYCQKFDNLIIYRANAPLVSKDEIKNAYSLFLKDTTKILVSVKKDFKNIYKMTKQGLSLVTNNNDIELFEEIKAFKILSFNSLNNKAKCQSPYILPYDKSIEIDSYQDWWVCEKLLKQKIIVFNVIGSIEIGMGHIYHSLSLAHEVMDHEIIFVCDEKYEIAVEKIASTDYRVISTSDVTKTILDLKPDLVINDILNTDIKYIKFLKENNIKIVNFEDLGEGTQEANLVINELYDNPQLEGDNFLWGHKYLALRDEFDDAKPHEFVNTVNSVLITFGGTDQNNLTLLTLKSIINEASDNDVKIYIVCGGGYLYKKELEKYINNHKYKNIELTFAVGVISKIMEKTQIAFSSNGRAVYELADMNIPSIIISHHERENTHTFATLEKGFINLGVYKQTNIKSLIRSSFDKLTLDTDYRKLLFLNISKYKFRFNKQKVVKKILELL